MNQKTLHEYARDFIDTKRAAGMLYKSGEYGLNRYLTYHEKEFSDCTYPTKESVHDYFGTFANLYCKCRQIGAFMSKTSETLDWYVCVSEFCDISPQD